MSVQLRVYPRPEGDEIDSPVPSVRMSLGDLLPLMAMAQRQNNLWLQDFLDDEVIVTEDLYEILRAFRSYRPSA